MPIVKNPVILCERNISFCDSMKVQYQHFSANQRKVKIREVMKLSEEPEETLDDLSIAIIGTLTLASKFSTSNCY